jgi:hypothetical protein
VDYWREGLDGGISFTVFEEQTNFRTWIGDLACLIWLRLWLSLGGIMVLVWRVSVMGRGWRTGKCNLTALRREWGLKSWGTWGTTGVLALSLLCQQRFRPFNVSQRPVASV